MRAERVHIRDARGVPIYNRLFDDGTACLRFEVYGFIDRHGLRGNGWTIHAGWLDWPD